MLSTRFGSRSLRIPRLHTATRTISEYSRPGPPPLPRDQQLEFEELQKQTESLPNPAMSTSASAATSAQTSGEPYVNPQTGEQGGPKTEPVGQWGKQNEGDWSFRGRVSDF